MSDGPATFPDTSCPGVLVVPELRVGLDTEDMPIGTLHELAWLLLSITDIPLQGAYVELPPR